MADSLRKLMRVRFDANRPMEFAEVEGTPDECSETQSEMLDQVSKTVMAYVIAARRLATEKYPNLDIPNYLRRPARVLLVLCDDGIVVRYEGGTSAGLCNLRGAFGTTGMIETASALSQQLVRIRPPGTDISFDPQAGMGFTIQAVNADHSESHTFLNGRIVFDVELSEQSKHRSGGRPFRLLSVRNEFEIELHGLLMERGSIEGKPFIRRRSIPLGGWDCVEVFQGIEKDQWAPEHAETWAELDILSYALTAQLRRTDQAVLDPRAAVRRQFAELLREFRDLLDSNPEREEILQRYLQDHPELLWPSHSKVWPKLPFGKHVSDFVFRDVNGSYVLVELERSTLKPFVQTGHQSAELTHAIGQVTDWKRYIEDNLSTVRGELELRDITADPLGLVVLGRRSGLTTDNVRKLRRMNDEAPRMRILTYDDLYDHARAIVENLFGPIGEPGGEATVAMDT